MRRILSCLLPLLLLPTPCLAGTWHVLVDGTGDAPTIQAGIDSAAVGDTVLVGPGTYHEVIDFLGKNVVVKSSSGPEVTILDGSGLGRYVVSFLSHEGRSAILQGMTVTGGGLGIVIFQATPSIINNIVRDNNGTPDNPIGSGILMTGDGEPGPWSPLIQGNMVISNTAAWTGPGIACQKKMIPEIVDNYIAYNHAGIGDGAGIWIEVEFDGMVIQGNTIEHNLAGDHGGGIYFVGLTGTPSVEIAYNVLTLNTAEGQEDTGNSGGGIWLQETNAWVHHNTIVQNTGRGGSSHAYGGGIAISDDPGSPLIEQNIIAYSLDGSGIHCDDPSTPTIRNNLAWQNVGGEGTGTCSDWALSNGNLIADPIFCGLATGDFSLAANSPALSHPAGPLGAIPTPGCQSTPVERTTWGQIKARYR